MAEPDPPVADTEERISEEILRLHEQSYGVGGKVKTHLLEDEVIVIIDVELTRAERTLIEAGKVEAVRGTRTAFQEAIEATFKALVERQTGRRVEAFLSQMSMDPVYSVEFFRLGPRERYQTP